MAHQTALQIQKVPEFIIWGFLFISASVILSSSLGGW
jgi:hypothetical protein